MFNFEQPSVLSVYKPFFEEVEEGESSFTIFVPRNYGSYTVPNVEGSGSGDTKKREFYFSDFHLTPSFYSARAAQLGLDSDPANAKKFLMEFRFYFTVSPELFRTGPNDNRQDIKFMQENKIYQLDKLLQAINAYFEFRKPEGFIHSPFFFDWCDKYWYKNQEDSIEKYYGEDDEEEEEGDEIFDFERRLIADDEVTELLEKYYEDIATDANQTPILTKFLGGLEPSLRGLKEANHFKFPDAVLADPTRLSDIRIRMHVAPNIRASFSSNKLLVQLGFTKDKRGDKNKIIYDNDLAEGYMIYVADIPPRNLTIAATDNTILLGSLATNYGTAPRICEFDAQKFKDNPQVHEVLKEKFAELSEISNLQMSLQYTDSESRFRIVYPASRFLTGRVICNIEFAERLGYGPITRLNPNMFAQPVSKSDNIVDAETKSRALAFDTDMIIATLDSSSSSRTHGLEEPLLGTLLPTESGTYNMKFQTAQRSVQLPTTGLGGGQFLTPFKVNLWSMKKGSEKMPLDWNVSFTVGGVLEGRAPFDGYSSSSNSNKKKR